jgi:hypothetical protein
MSALSHTSLQRLVAAIPVTSPMPAIVAIGIMVGLNFALAKFPKAQS